MPIKNIDFLNSLPDTIVRWWFERWIDPLLWLVLGIVFAGLTLLGTKPISIPRSSTEDVGLATHLGVRTRQLLLWTFAISLVFVQLVVALVGMKAYGFSQLVVLMMERSVERAFYWWEIPVAMWTGAAMLTFFFKRVVATRWSAFRRRLRMKQTGEELSDIRVEVGKLKAKMFLPSNYYRKDAVFFGMDASNKPIYMAEKDWRTKHMKIIGPTQTGKGVLLGVLVDQSIRAGDCVVVIDPKPDMHLREIMRKAAEESGRKFLELDLNDGSPHRWAPFAGGTQRDRRARLMSAFGLTDSGDAADFYKAGERAMLDSMLPNWSGDLVALAHLIQQKKATESMQRTVSYLNEWLAVSTYSPGKGRGFSVERAMKENAVVWVRGHLADLLTIKAATVFIMEVIQEALRLFNNGRTSHLYLVVDEVKFMISDTLANALATVAGFDMNCALAYQSLLDLRSLRDRSLNERSIEDSINVNCKLTVCYQAANQETAEWAAAMSGTIQKAVTKSESVKAGRYGAEEWEEDRMISREEVALIPENIMLALPERVGAFFRPGQLASVLYTAWVPVQLNHAQPKATEAKTEAVGEDDLAPTVPNHIFAAKPRDAGLTVARTASQNGQPKAGADHRDQTSTAAGHQQVRTNEHRNRSAGVSDNNRNRIPNAPAQVQDSSSRVHTSGAEQANSDSGPESEAQSHADNVSRNYRAHVQTETANGGNGPPGGNNEAGKHSQKTSANGNQKSNGNVHNGNRRNSQQPRQQHRPQPPKQAANDVGKFPPKPAPAVEPTADLKIASQPLVKRDDIAMVAVSPDTADAIIGE
jgi:type IV secretory pathway TraG/TraD family ATPase VirD4